MIICNSIRKCWELSEHLYCELEAGHKGDHYSSRNPAKKLFLEGNKLRHDLQIRRASPGEKSGLYWKNYQYSKSDKNKE